MKNTKVYNMRYATDLHKNCCKGDLSLKNFPNLQEDAPYGKDSEYISELPWNGFLLLTNKENVSPRSLGTTLKSKQGIQVYDTSGLSLENNGDHDLYLKRLM